MENEKIWYKPREVYEVFGHLIPCSSTRYIRRLIIDKKLKGRNISEGKKRSTFFVHIDDIKAYVGSIQH